MDALKEAYFGTSAQKGDRGYWRNLGSVLKYMLLEPPPLKKLHYISTIYSSFHIDVRLGGRGLRPQH